MSLRILSMDGGGIRGLSSLLILEHIMERIREAEGLAEVPRPCDRFDMIGGTSTGGIIAIMLGRLRMTVDECIRAYRKMAERAFTPKRTTILPASPRGAFSAKALEAAIRDIVKEFCPAAECVARRAGGHSTISTCKHSETEFRDPSCTATVVLAITKDNVDARPTLFTTYDTSTSLGGCTIWQVARATSAATTFFKPICVGRDGIEFIDAGFGCNNPCEVLIEEAGRRFPGRDRMQVVSIGTGLGKEVSIGDTRMGIIGALKKMATTSKAVADRLDDRFGDDGQYVRFNVEQGLQDTTLSDWKKASSISSHTRNYLNDKKRAVDKFVDVFLGRVLQAESREGDGTASAPEPPPRKPCRYLPFQRNRNFVGRASVMKTLEDKLFGDNDEASHRVAVVGLGGVGKTQVALQTAYWTIQNKPEWHVFWVPALSMASFQQACRAIAQMLELKGADKEDAKELLQRYLDSDDSGPWLLIVDNADDEEVVEGGKQDGEQGQEQGIRNFLPRTDRGHILFTTRTQRIATRLAQSEVVDLSQMSEDEARDLLKKSLVDKSLSMDEKNVVELLDILTCLPLAIVQAAAYLNETRASVAEYIRLLRNTERDMVELLETEFTDDTRYRERHNAVASTWVVSFEQIRKNKDAARLLRFIALVESKAIPRSMLPPAGSEQKMTRAIGVLCGYSFLSTREDGTTYDMHRLVHLASRIWVARQDDAGQQRRAALSYLTRLFSNDEWEERVTWRHFLPHMLKAIEVSKELNEWGEEESCVGVWVGRFLQKEGRSQEAVKLLRQVVAVHKTTLAETDPGRLSSQHALAVAYEADGRISEAIPLIEEVVAVRKRTLAETDPNRLASQHQLATAYLMDGRVKEAVSLLEQLVAVCETTLTETHPKRLRFQQVLAMAYEADGRVKEAISILERVVAVHKTTLCEAHRDRLRSQNALAIAYLADRRVKEATSLLEQLVAVRETTLAETHPDRLVSQQGLAKAYLVDGRIKEAIPILERIVVILESTQAETHLLRQASQHNLAEAYYTDRRTKEAISLLERVLVFSGLTQPHRLAFQHILAIAYEADGRVKEGISLLEQVVVGREMTLAETDPHRLSSQYELARLYYSHDQDEKAVGLIEQVVAVHEMTQAETHPELLASQRVLALAYFSTGQKVKAVELLEHVVNVRRKFQSEDHPLRIGDERDLRNMRGKQRASS